LLGLAAMVGPSFLALAWDEFQIFRFQ